MNFKSLPEEDKIAILKDVAKKYGRGYSPDELCERHSLTKSQISDMVKKMRERGVDIPFIRAQKTPFTKAIQELKAEDPHLVIQRRKRRTRAEMLVAELSTNNPPNDLIPEPKLKPDSKIADLLRDRRFGL